MNKLKKDARRIETKPQRKLRMLELLGAKCANCGATENLEFDHLNPQEKVFKITDKLDISDAKLIEEVKKCQLLCKKCHHQKTLDLNEYGEKAQHGTITMYKKWKCRCELCKKAMHEYYLLTQKIKDST